jgi:Fe-S-cluster-containing dehydrogenase component
MSQPLDRRRFLKVLGASAGAGVAATVAGGGQAEARAPARRPEHALGLLFDGTLCIGCRACIGACKEANDLPPSRTELVGGDYWQSPLDTAGTTYNVIKAYRDGLGVFKDQVEDGYAFTKQSCFHCVDPSCVSACPVSAMTKDSRTGIVGYNEEACIGCRYCVAACPFGVPRFTYDRASPRIGKCELCRHRLAEGQIPACAEVCPTGATVFGRVDAIDAEISRRKALAPGTVTSFHRGRLDGEDTYRGPVGRYVEHVYGEKEIGGTQVKHLSGVPFELLGKPTLPDEAPARRSETLQHGIYYGLVAPLTFLGIAAAAARRNMRAADGEAAASPPPAPPSAPPPAPPTKGAP